MQKTQSVMPTVATLANLSAGVLAIVLAVGGKPDVGALMILVAMLFDSADGALARAFDACTDFGGELDSLADVISFSVAPGILIVAAVPEQYRVFATVGAIALGACGALRLARYNVTCDEKDAEGGFEGMPSTAAGGCVASAVLFQGVLAQHGLETTVVFLPWVALLFAVLMVSNMKYPHIGVVFGKMPTVLGLTLGALVGVAAFVWAHEIVFFVCFYAYALSGPVLTVTEKVIAYHEANAG